MGLIPLTRSRVVNDPVKLARCRWGCSHVSRIVAKPNSTGTGPGGDVGRPKRRSTAFASSFHLLFRNIHTACTSYRCFRLAPIRQSRNNLPVECTSKTFFCWRRTFFNLFPEFVVTKSGLPRCPRKRLEIQGWMMATNS